MFLIQVLPPTSILIDTFTVVKVSVAFILLGGVLWVVRKLIKTVNRS